MITSLPNKENALKVCLLLRWTRVFRKKRQKTVKVKNETIDFLGSQALEETYRGVKKLGTKNWTWNEESCAIQRHTSHETGMSVSVSVVQKHLLLKLATVTSVTSNSCVIVHLSGCFVNYNLLATV